MLDFENLWYCIGIKRVRQIKINRTLKEIKNSEIFNLFRDKSMILLRKTELE